MASGAIYVQMSFIGIHFINSNSAGSASFTNMVPVMFGRRE